jgi:oligo-1,6-glucosidase/alpha-glucosidase
MDSAGDGIGDLKGIISKLDYIQELGVETIWFSPFYPSPTDKPYKEHDCGYDIKDYQGIGPEYGTMATFDELLEEMHSRGLKMMLDMVMNHTSSEHPWFIESRSSRDNPKREWYIWRDGRKPGGKKPPTNWRSITGKAWEYDPQTEQWYYHAFLPFQPDLNYRNPEVQEEMLDTVRFWLKKGVDGYRLDIFQALFVDAEFRNAPLSRHIYSEDLDILFQSSKRTLHHPDTIEFAQKLRKTLDEFPGKFMVGEIQASNETLKKYLGDVTEDGTNNTGLNLVFLFQSTTAAMKAKKFRKLIKDYEEWYPQPYIPTWVFGNHDQTRRITKIGNSLEKAKLNAALQLTARGVPFIYYGEEIGMQNISIPKKEARDAISYVYGWVPQFLRNLLKKIVLINRDECRTPMQWDTSANAGFSPAGVETWLPVDPEYQARNVQVEEEDPDSLLHCYKRFLKARKETPALNAGSLELLYIKGAPKSVLAYVRKTMTQEGEQRAHVFLNFRKKSVKFPNPIMNSRVLVSTSVNSSPVEGVNLTLAPWEGIVLIP